MGVMVRRTTRVLMMGLVVVLVGAACGDDDAPQSFGDGILAEDCPEGDVNADGTCRTAPRPPDETGQGANTDLDCDAPDSVFFAPALGKGQADPVAAARATLTGSPIGLSLEDATLEERSPGDVYVALPDDAVHQGRVVGFVSTVEYKDGTWGPGRAQWCVDFERSLASATFGPVLACEEPEGVSAIPLQRDQAPTLEEAVSRIFSDPEYGPGPDFTVEEWENGVTWIVRDPLGDIVGAAVPIEVPDGTWALSEWTYCP